ncbi:MAG: serine hydrolase [Clostridia bacterium]|jgi:CubicO group peptidase (beta-lactamase class C family)|nr:serine hydrolase [Clostridia bacterium]
MDKHITDFENLIKTEYDNIAGIVVVKNGERIYEGYFGGFTSEDTAHVMSVTKSILSALIGIAIDKGYIKSVDQKVLEFFPDYMLKRGEKTIQNVTIRNMLTMTAPYKYKSEPYTKVYTSDDWTKAALDLLGGRAGITSEFKYSTVGTQILSGILASTTDKSVVDFATENLFEPLGIKAPHHHTTIHNKEEYIAFLKDKHVSGWMVDPKGMNTAGWGLCLAPRDMAKIGQLYLNGGLYNDRRILSSKWIEDSTKEKSRWGELPYGYLWWIIDSKGSHCYAAIGDGGNVIFVNPEKNMVVAIASRFMLRSKVLTELITEHIVPLFE